MFDKQRAYKLDKALDRLEEAMRVEDDERRENARLEAYREIRQVRESYEDHA